MSEVTYDRVAEAYVKTREEIRALEAKIKELDKIQDKREEWFLAALQSQGLKNVKTEHGTAFITRKESVTVADWDTLRNWVETTGKWEFVNKSVNKTAVLEQLGDERTGDLPPGVNYSSTRVVQFRK
jgi:hypothetical protein